MASSSFSAYRTTDAHRTNDKNDEASKDLKGDIRQSRWIQPEQWLLPEIQDKFAKVKLFFRPTKPDEHLFPLGLRGILGDTRDTSRPSGRQGA